MKSFDVERAMARGSMPLGIQLLDANAGRIRSGFVDYRKTHIVQTAGSAESEPYARDAALASFATRKALHTALDRLCCDANMHEAKVRGIHDSLDRAVDEAEAECEPEEEEPEEEAEDDASIRKQLHRALDVLIDAEATRETFVAADARRSKITDAPRTRPCFCCGHLDGVKGYNEAHRWRVI